MSAATTQSADSLFKAGLKAEAAQQYVEALFKFSASLEFGANLAPTWRKIGMLYLRMTKYVQAAENLEFALTLEPENVQATYGLAIAYFYLGRLEESCALIDKAALAQPNNSTVVLDRANIRSIHNSDRALKLELYRDWGQRFADPLAMKSKPFDNDLRPDKKLRIGYVSGDMREHAVAFFMEPVFANHNANRVEVFVFSTSKQKDTVTDRLKKLVPNWFDVSQQNDDALFNLIRKKRIDVLVDLSGHTQGHRLFVFARRAAPVQVTWLGYMGGTLGMQAMDYRLTDFNMDPAGNENFFVEKLFRLKCMASYLPPANTPLAPEPPILSTGKPMLISLNSSRKITDEMLLIWRRILELRPDAQLFIHVQENSGEDAVATMEPRLTKMGLPLDRIILSPRIPIGEFMESGTLADIALDTAPISGGTTTLHTLWMGLPIVTLKGHDAVSSSTAAILEACGLDDWVAENADEYISHVLKLIDNPETLIHHRASIRGKMMANALMRYDERCLELEQAYQMMWINHLKGNHRYLISQPFDAETRALLKQYA